MWPTEEKFNLKRKLKKIGTVGGKIKMEGKTHSRCLPQASWQQRALDPFIDLGRAAGQKIKEQYNCKKEAMRKNWNGQGKIKGRGKLTATAFCKQVTGRYGREGPLIP